MAFSMDSWVSSCSGVNPALASFTACSPVASDALRRSACTAGIAAVPGSVNPRVSEMHAIVLAVPMTGHVPAVVASRPSIKSISVFDFSPARY